MPNPEQRQHARFATDVEVHFHVPYTLRTEVDFTLTENPLLYTHTGFSKNISAYGLCFETNIELKIGDYLWLELHLPDSQKIVYMQGVVRWCQAGLAAPEMPPLFLVGVEVRMVDGVNIEQTIYFDRKYGVIWSELLERVLGTYAQMHNKQPSLTVLRGILRDNNDRYLMVRRSSKCQTWPSKWEFPGGKADPGEPATSALKREFREEVSLEIAPLQRFLDFTFERPQGNVEYKIFFVEKISGEPAISDEHDALGWFTVEEMQLLDVSAPLLDVIARLKKEH